MDLPGRISGHTLRFSIRQQQVQLRPDQRTVVNDARVAPHVPAAAQPQRHAVLARGQVVRDIVSQVQVPFRVVADRRAQDVVVHLPPVDIQLVVAQRVDVGHGPPRLLLQFEGLAQPGEGQRGSFLHVRRTPEADEPAGPFGITQEHPWTTRPAHSTAKAGRPCPRRGPSSSNLCPRSAAGLHRRRRWTGRSPLSPNPRGLPGRSGGSRGCWPPAHDRRSAAAHGGPDSSTQLSLGFSASIPRGFSRYSQVSSPTEQPFCLAAAFPGAASKSSAMIAANRDLIGKPPPPSHGPRHERGMGCRRERRHSHTQPARSGDRKSRGAGQSKMCLPVDCLLTPTRSQDSLRLRESSLIRTTPCDSH